VLTSRWSRGRVAALAYRYGHWRTTVRLSPGNTLPERLLRAVALKNLGDASGATVLLDGALAELRTASAFGALVNFALDLLIAVGRYREALELETSMGPRRGWQWAVAQANFAEAEYCQGRVQAAQARLANPEIDRLSAKIPFATSAVGLQRAWLAVMLGDSHTALAQMASISPTDCPRSYRAEWHFTSAAAHSLAGHPDLADAAVELGARISLRSSSTRNALALRGALMRTRRKLPEAEHWLSLAAAHPWQGQSGGLLLAWGEVLHELGHGNQAATAWQRAVAQDPESEAAALAAKRLPTTAASW
jgi:hypothetical protein